MTRLAITGSRRAPNVAPESRRARKEWDREQRPASPQLPPFTMSSDWGDERSPGARASRSAPRLVVEPTALPSASWPAQVDSPPTPGRQRRCAPRPPFVLPELLRLESADPVTRGAERHHFRFGTLWPDDAQPAGALADVGNALRTGPMNDHRLDGGRAEHRGVTYTLRPSPAPQRVPADAPDAQTMLGIPPLPSRQQRVPGPSAASAAQEAPCSVCVFKHMDQEQRTVSGGGFGNSRRDDGQLLEVIHVDDLNVLAPDGP